MDFILNIKRTAVPHPPRHIFGADSQTLCRILPCAKILSLQDDRPHFSPLFVSLQSVITIFSLLRSPLLSLEPLIYVLEKVFPIAFIITACPNCPCLLPSATRSEFVLIPSALTPVSFLSCGESQSGSCVGHSLAYCTGSV
jgi:hypothetical protein